ncbi:uncharacterized protein [Lepeophtheirus salmonis]|uniref:uncharacterized protein n=1 Tax=Lepeophtheirus salmonis TaxID=72036 RepID=UPI001AE4D717|nr:uncharacterized protein LOC121117998 [Lepeophtheirus salmonis]XP_040568466.1 uncharacterized protein LOC121117998 [Lepeophtheirus salmonis]
MNDGDRWLATTRMGKEPLKKRGKAPPARKVKNKKKILVGRRSFPSKFNDLLPRELEVTCGDAVAIWHSQRFKRGHKSKCILYMESWISPLRFYNMTKRTIDSNWKESIQYDGASLSSLFHKLKQCKNNCKCTLCNDNLIQKENNIEVPSPEASLLPPTPLRPHPPISKKNSAPGLSNHVIQTVKAALTQNETQIVRQRFPDLNSAVQKALICLEGAEASQLNILLFILNNYDVDSNDIALLNKRLRRSLEFLTRMDILKKSGESENEDISESEPEEATLVDPSSKKPRKLKDPKYNVVKKTKKSQINSKENKVKKPIIQKLKRLSPTLSSLCGGVRKLSRRDVVRKVWVYIKKRNLQDSNRKHIVKCDDKLRELSNEDEFDYRRLFRHLDSHMFGLETRDK